MASIIGIIGAMSIEIDGIVARMTDKETETVSGVTYVRGKLCGQDTVAAVCGIGKVFAAICTQTMILRYQPTLIINTGVAGGIAPDLKIGDVVMASAVVQHDMDTSPIGDPLGLLSGINKIYLETDSAATEKIATHLNAIGVRTASGILATGDQFVATQEKKNFIRATFSGTACDMEGGSIAQSCYVNGVSFVAVRAISDSADEEASIDYPTFARAAAEHHIEALCGCIGTLL